MFSPCDAPNIRSNYSITSTAVTAEDTNVLCVRARVTYSSGGEPPPPVTIQFTTSVVPDFEMETPVPTPWARKGALYQPMTKVKDVWRAKWRLSQQRPRDGLHSQQ